jgi:phosphoglycolate phosphatase-like HAD superfamily hydrolase
MTGSAPERRDARAARSASSVVVTDLDNTLWDWVELWYRAFRPMLDRLVSDSGVPVEQLEVEIKAVHERHGTAEYAFLIQELPSLQAKHPGADLRSVYKDAIDTYRAERNKALALYPGVLETLEVLRDKGCLIVGYTESRAYYTQYRMRKLGLDRIFDYLYSPPDHALPDGKTAADIRMHEASHYEFRRTQHRHTPEGELKPNPGILRDIMREIGAAPEQVVYVGDNLMKDVAMAQSAGVLDAWAKYGIAQDRKEYELLRRVTHWSAAAVQKEKDITQAEVRPTLILTAGFGELLEVCRFVPFRATPGEREKVVVDIWKKTIDVQQHFNDLELRIRNYAVTVLVAILGASAFAVKENLSLAIFGFRISVASTLVAAGAGAWLAFYLMDRFWYHRLLYGAVKHALSIERRWARELPELSLTGAIGDESPVHLFGRKIRSPRKIDLFYWIVFGLTILMAGAIQCGARPAGAPAGPSSASTPVPVQPTPTAAIATGTPSTAPASSAVGATADPTATATPVTGKIGSANPQVAPTP